MLRSLFLYRFSSSRYLLSCRGFTEIKVTSPHNPKVKRLEVDDYPKDEFPLNKQMLTKLEQLSALRFENNEEIKSVEEDIQLAQKVFEVDTTGVEPLYSIVEEIINCPLREDDVVEDTSAKHALQNAPVVIEDFIVCNRVNPTKTQTS